MLGFTLNMRKTWTRESLSSQASISALDEPATDAVEEDEVKKK